MDTSRVLKRQKKTLLACTPCRSKKSKCDGCRPVCGACQKNGCTETKCTWKRIDGKEAMVPEWTVRALQNKIKELERTQHVENVASPCTHSSHESAAATATNHREGEEHIAMREERRTVGVSAMVAAVTGEPQYEGFQGPSSAAAFMSNIRQAVDDNTQSPDASFVVGLRPEHAVGSGTAFPKSNPELQRDYVLPPRKVADALLRSYWMFIYPLYPVLNRGMFDECYDSLWTGSSLPVVTSALMRLDENTLVCMLNIVLALACQYSDEITPGKAFSTAEVFFTRARELFRFDAVDSTDYIVPHLQVMLLIAQYLQGTGRAYKAWNIIAVAIRTCHQLGLHLATTSSPESIPNVVERELVKRVYHFCLLTERMLCMSLGRPVMISICENDPVPLPLEVDDEDLHLFPDPENCDFSNPEQNTRPSIMSFFIHSAKLHRIAQRILSLSHVEESRNSESDSGQYLNNLQAVLKLDNDLVELYSDIPAYLRQINPRTFDDEVLEERRIILHRQSVVLHLRHLQARISLFRPILVKFCSTRCHSDEHGDDLEDPSSIPFTETLSYRTGLQCSFLCVKTARRLIKVMYENFANGDGWGAKPNWLYGVLHIYLSATVLIAARLRPVIRLNEISESDLEESWLRALKILETFQSDSLAAQRCVAALRILYRKVPQAMSNTPTNLDGGVGQTMADNRQVDETRHIENRMTIPFWVTGDYHALPQTDEDNLGSMLDLSWANFIPEFPETFMDSYGSMM